VSEILWRDLYRYLTHGGEKHSRRNWLDGGRGSGTVTANINRPADGAVTVSAPPIGLPGARDRNPDYPYLDPNDLIFALSDLFASDPVLAQEVFNLGAAQRARGKRFAAFHYLFIDATSPTLGTKYTVCGIVVDKPKWL
jgi:hypothetical protein